LHEESMVEGGDGIGITEIKAVVRNGYGRRRKQTFRSIHFNVK